MSSTRVAASVRVRSVTTYLNTMEVADVFMDKVLVVHAEVEGLARRISAVTTATKAHASLTTFTSTVDHNIGLVTKGAVDEGDGSNVEARPVCSASFVAGPALQRTTEAQAPTLLRMTSMLRMVVLSP